MSIQDYLVHILVNFPEWLSIIIISAIPVTELRASIPIAILQYKMSPLDAYLFSVIGNILPIIPILLFLEPVSNYLRQFKIWDKFFTWLFDRTQKNNSKTFDKYKSLALAIFVAIPLPGTGAWSGCAAAFVFGIKFKKAFISIAAGVLIAGFIVTVITLGGIGIFNIFT